MEFGTWHNVRALGAKDAAFLEILEADAPTVENRIATVQAASVQTPPAQSGLERAGTVVAAPTPLSGFPGME